MYTLIFFPNYILLYFENAGLMYLITVWGLHFLRCKFFGAGLVQSNADAARISGAIPLASLVTNLLF